MRGGLAALAAFEVAFDTHTQPLTDDLMKSGELIASSGTGAAPLDWQGDPPGGHHRKGVLRFKALQPAPGAIELHIRRPGENAPRSFRWTLK